MDSVIHLFNNWHLTLIFSYSLSTGLCFLFNRFDDIWPTSTTWPTPPFRIMFMFVMVTLSSVSWRTEYYQTMINIDKSFCNKDRRWQEIKLFPRKLWSKSSSLIRLFVAVVIFLFLFLLLMIIIIIIYNILLLLWLLLINIDWLTGTRFFNQTKASSSAAVLDGH